jgi:hypothetical protein
MNLAPCRSTPVLINMISVDERIFLARVTDHSDRFEDMEDFLKPVLDSKGVFVTSDKRSLLV